MNSKDHMKEKDRTGKMSGSEKAKEYLKEEGIKRDKKIQEEKQFQDSAKVGQKQTLTGNASSQGTHKTPVSEPGNPNVRITEEDYSESGSKNSKDDFLSGIKKNKSAILSIAGVVAGGALLFRAAKKGLSSSGKSHKIELHTRQTVNRSRQDLYAYWRNLENLPKFMSHIKEVRKINERKSKWTAEIPGGVGTIDWEAVIEQDRKDEFISWRSVADSDIENAGEVKFKDARGGKGTIVETTISYRPPAGKVGEYTAKFLNPAFEKVVKNDLKQFKTHMEEGREELGERFLY